MANFKKGQRVFHTAQRCFMNVTSPAQRGGYSRSGNTMRLEYRGVPWAADPCLVYGGEDVEAAEVFAAQLGVADASLERWFLGELGKRSLQELRLALRLACVAREEAHDNA